MRRQIAWACLAGTRRGVKVAVARLKQPGREVGRNGNRRLCCGLRCATTVGNANVVPRATIKGKAELTRRASEQIRARSIIVPPGYLNSDSMNNGEYLCNNRFRLGWRPGAWNDAQTGRPRKLCNVSQTNKSKSVIRGVPAALLRAMFIESMPLGGLRQAKCLRHPMASR